MRTELTDARRARLSGACEDDQRWVAYCVPPPRAWGLACRDGEGLVLLRHLRLGPADVVSGGSRMVPISTPSGEFRVWTKRVGTNPDLKVLLLHGGPGATDELYECFDAWFPRAGIEYYYYDQLGSFRSDQPDDPSLWDARPVRRRGRAGPPGARPGREQLRAARAVLGRAARDGVRRRTTSSTSRAW